MNTRTIKWILLAGWCACAFQAHAAVVITEIMYDVSGADAGREWVEVTNTGSAPVDITGYKFFEGNTNHGLVSVAGTGVLQAGASAVIADDSVQFLADWPAFSGTLFDSSFSLSNAGEAIGFKNGSLETVDSVSYDPSAGAQGDGNSLHRMGSVFMPAAPTPGSHTGSQPPADPDASAAASSATPASLNAKSNVPTLAVSLSTDAVSTVGGGSFFSAEALGTAGEPLTTARFIWNFGDGETAEGQSVFHAYAYPGTYIASVTASSGYAAGAARMTVVAAPAAVSLRHETDGSVTILNRSERELNVGAWTIVRGGGTFVMPKDTRIVAGGGVRLSPALLQLPDGAAELRYPNGAVAARESIDAHAAGITYLPPAEVPVPSASVQHATVSAPPAAIPIAAAEPNALAAAPVLAGEPPFSLPLIWSVLALAAIVLIASASVLSVRLSRETAGVSASSGRHFATIAPPETSLRAEEFEIIEVDSKENKSYS